MSLIYKSNTSLSMMKTKINEAMDKLSKSQTPEVLKDFCESTTLHGYSYFGIADSVLAKTVWAIIILLATGTGLSFLVTNTKAYMQATIVTNIESSSDNLHVSNLKKTIEKPIRNNCDPIGCCLSIYNYL